MHIGDNNNIIAYDHVISSTKYLCKGTIAFGNL